MGDYEMLMVVIATIGLAMAACKDEVSKGVFPAVQGMAEFLFLMSPYLKSPHFQVCARLEPKLPLEGLVVLHEIMRVLRLGLVSVSVYTHRSRGHAYHYGRSIGAVVGNPLEIDY